MRHDDLPPRWKAKIRQWISTYGDDSHARLGAGDFPSSSCVHLKFEDGSTAAFNFAIVMEAPELNEIGFFTEHCGYHIFSLDGTHVARIET